MQPSKKLTLFRGPAAMAVAVLLLAGCKDSPLTAPKLVATPTPPDIWNNTVEGIAVTTGPDNCFGSDGGGFVGQVHQTTFELRRTGDSVVFVPLGPDALNDAPTYTGTVNGTNFTAASPAWETTFQPCGHFRYTGSLSGRFSEDRTHLTATEVWTYTFDSGQVWTMTFSWSASRR